jgi:peptidoglycan L-alanyl-D-glutamate endopeptidase CwlK
MSFTLGNNSRAKLNGVHPKLVAVIERAIEITEQDFSVLEGCRSQQRQWELYGQGRTIGEMRAAGAPMSVLAQPAMPKVTWVTKSNHMPKPDGFGHAVDLVPYPLDWNDLSKYDAIKRAMFAAAAELKTKLRWGADWDCDGKPREKGETDNPHFELA